MIDLHGRLDQVFCTSCGVRLSRESFQEDLGRLNADWLDLEAIGRARRRRGPRSADFSAFAVPACEACGGVLKPDVVFFGENVPRSRVDEARAHLEQSDAMLVVGSSLMVYSGFRFAEAAAQLGKPVGGRQSRPDARRPSADPEGRTGLRNGAGFSSVVACGREKRRRAPFSAHPLRGQFCHPYTIHTDGRSWRMAGKDSFLFPTGE